MLRGARALGATMLRVACLLSVFAACGAAATRPAEPAPAARSPIELTYTGVAGWQITDGHTTVLTDPFFSRQPIPKDPTTPVKGDAALVAKYAPAHADLIVVGHSHFDHLLDAPAVALRTGAQVMGSASTIHYARASGVPDDHLVPVKGGEDYDFGAFSVRAIPSLHSAIGDKHGKGLALGEIIPDGVTLPLTASRFAEGGTLAYLVRLGGHEVLVLDTANFIERELDGLRPDVAIVAPGGRQEIHAYACRLMHALGAPPVVIATHFDEWTKPLADDTKLDDDTRADLAAFTDEIHACAPKTRVIVPEHGVPLQIL
jgi:L-ascorbate metabolism protein UlaG (beta-lactamase superfamily)